MKRYPYFLIALLIVLADQLTKFLARVYIGTFDTVKVLPFLQLVSVRNEGAAFGMFRGLGNPAFIVVSLVAIAVVFFLLLTSKEDGWGLALILGGAAGNLIDRIVFKKVTDFIDLFAGRFHWPAFNVADSALTVGLVILLVSTLVHHRRERSV
ncbi:MAG TPA: signal peptidase II [Thermodesulfovibrionales bacterium]|jgi:signal peptidase II|nr:signal peptidase II [Thermodesulfovibrionales bacterium]